MCCTCAIQYNVASARQPEAWICQPSSPYPRYAIQTRTPQVRQNSGIYFFNTALFRQCHTGKYQYTSTIRNEILTNSSSITYCQHCSLYHLYFVQAPKKKKAIHQFKHCPLVPGSPTHREPKTRHRRSSQRSQYKRRLRPLRWSH